MIYKYILEERDINVLQLHEYFTILKVARQNDQICVWVKCNPRRKLIPITFRIFGTGNPMPEDEFLIYLDTVIMDYFVWHVFLKDKGE